MEYGSGDLLRELSSAYRGSSCRTTARERYRERRALPGARVWATRVWAIRM